MNYRHAFHAGNFADVVKHIILALILTYLQRKPGAVRVIDTHAGIGRYDLTGSEAQRSPEWRQGIAPLLSADLPAAVAERIAPYLDVVRGENPDGALRTYPGSPLIVRRLMRAQDRLMALELHKDDVQTLSALFAGDHQVRVTALDGYLALGAYLPPKESRALVLVDPPFEAEGEFSRMVDGLARAHKRFATGVYALWYPLKDRHGVNSFIADLKATGIDRMLRVELGRLKPPPGDAPFFGTGMIVVNPPFTLVEDLAVVLPYLAALFGEAGQGWWKAEWLGEAP